MLAPSAGWALWQDSELAQIEPSEAPAWIADRLEAGESLATIVEDLARFGATRCPNLASSPNGTVSHALLGLDAAQTLSNIIRPVHPQRAAVPVMLVAPLIVGEARRSPYHPTPYHLPPVVPNDLDPWQALETRDADLIEGAWGDRLPEAVRYLALGSFGHVGHGAIFAGLRLGPLGMRAAVRYLTSFHVPDEPTELQAGPVDLMEAAATLVLEHASTRGVPATLHLVTTASALVRLGGSDAQVAGRRWLQLAAEGRTELGTLRRRREVRVASGDPREAAAAGDVDETLDRLMGAEPDPLLAAEIAEWSSIGGRGSIQHSTKTAAATLMKAQPVVMAMNAWGWIAGQQAPDGLYPACCEALKIEPL
jgi:hypothetical protein